MHESEEWKDVGRRLTTLETGQFGIKGDLKRLEDQQQERHKDNLERFGNMELAIFGKGDSNPGLVRKMDTLLSYGKATAFWGKVLAWILAFLIACLTVWFAHLEASGKISQTTSQTHQDATQDFSTNRR
jgi:hypothetical protein